MEIHEFGPDDASDIAAYVELTNAVRAADTPWQHPVTALQSAALFRYGWDCEPPVGFLAMEGGEPVGVAEYETTEWDNRHLAWLWIAVPPALRRRGYGSAILETMLARARAEGRTSVGGSGWDSDRSRAFAAHHGFEEKSRDVIRRQTLAEVDWSQVEKLHEEAAAHATAYELVRRVGATPDEELSDLATLTATINDAPTDDLDIEDEVFPPERVRDYEAAQTATGVLHRVVARHRETGELAGHTLVVVERERPWIGHQHDTAVARTHRGHRLGLLVKTEMMRWLHDEQPELATLDTGNAESNEHMIAVNEQLGYRAMGRVLEFQRSL